MRLPTRAVENANEPLCGIGAFRVTAYKMFSRDQTIGGGRKILCYSVTQHIDETTARLFARHHRLYSLSAPTMYCRILVVVSYCSGVCAENSTSYPTKTTVTSQINT